MGLDVLLQYHLSTDQSAVVNLPSVIAALSPSLFHSDSPHIRKWTTRLSALIQAKIPGARWAGLCLARETALHDKGLMVECASTWVSIALPLLSKPESPPVLKAAVRLLSTVFTSVLDMPEFLRQVITPNVQKFSLALITLAESHVTEQVLRLLVLDTLTHLLQSHPQHHRALQPRLQTLTSQILSGSYPIPTDARLMSSAIALHSVLHLTGGKVAGTVMWRKNLDLAASDAHSALDELVSHSSGTSRSQRQDVQSYPNDPLATICHALDRLRCSTQLVASLLSASNPRPVVLPLGALVELSVRLLTVTQLDPESSSDHRSRLHTDPNIQSIRDFCIPEIWEMGCSLVERLALSARHHLTPHISQLINILIFHLERPLSPSSRLPFLRLLRTLLSSSHSQPIHTPLPQSRLLKAVLPSLISLLPSSSSSAEGKPTTGTGADGKGKRKRKAKGYEGDEVFRSSKESMIENTKQADEVFAALDALPSLLTLSLLPPQLKSLTSRILLSLLLTFTSISPISVSSTDLSLQSRILQKVQDICQILLASGDDGLFDKSLGMVIGTVGKGTHENQQFSSTISLLIHPRLPPIHRPHNVDHVVLAQSNELSTEEKELRKALGLSGGKEDIVVPDAPRDETNVATTSTVAPTIAPSTSNTPPPPPTPAPIQFHSSFTPSATSFPTTIPLAPTSTSPQLSGASNVNETEELTTRTPFVPPAWATAPSDVPVDKGTSVESVPMYTGRDEDMDDDDDDEEMPKIDMGDDSDEE